MNEQVDILLTPPTPQNDPNKHATVILFAILQPDHNGKCKSILKYDHKERKHRYRHTCKGT